MGRGRLIYLVAGDPSGDRLAAGLMHALSGAAPGIRFVGIGGREMKAAGLAPLFDLREIRPAGIVGALARPARLLTAAIRTAHDVLATAPDVLVTIDGPDDLGVAVARRVRRRSPGLPTVHYGAPRLGAATPGRSRRMAGAIDRVLALLPFECPPLQEMGLTCDFVGHPVAEHPPVAPELAARYRAELGIRPDRPLVLLAPGSTRAEVRQLLPLFRRCVENLAADRPGLGVVVPMAPSVAGAIEAGLRGMRPSPHLVRPEAGEEPKWRAMAAADAALAAPGAVTLELAAAATPMVVCRRANLTASTLGRGAEGGPSALVNLVAGAEAVPEFHKREARPDAVGPTLAELLDDEEVRTRQLAALEDVMTTLGRVGDRPSVRAARSVLGAIAVEPRSDAPPTGRTGPRRSRD